MSSRKEKNKLEERQYPLVKFIVATSDIIVLLVSLSITPDKIFTESETVKVCIPTVELSVR